MELQRRLFLLYAGILEYPDADVKRKAGECAQLVAEAYPAAGEAVGWFWEWVNKTSSGQVEEVYTSTFDLQGMCCPYIGHYLFGDNYRRSWFMASLNHGYHERGFSSGSELPDHLASVLRFLALCSDDAFSQSLREEGLAPAVEKMAALFENDQENPYGRVIQSLALFVSDQRLEAANSLASPAVGGLAHD